MLQIQSIIKTAVYWRKTFDLGRYPLIEIITGVPPQKPSKKSIKPGHVLGLQVFPA